MHSQFEFGISNAVNKIGDYVQFMDFPINGEMIHNYCFNRQDIINVFLNIAKDNTIQFSENDLAIAADLVSRGYVLKNKNKLTVNAPVFTVAQRQKLKEILSAASEKIADKAELIMYTVKEILENHIPVHLKKYAKNMAYFRLFEDSISAPIANLIEQKYLIPYNGYGILPTTYIVLK